MTDAEYRSSILAIEAHYDLELRKLLIRKQSGNATFVRLPELVYWTPEATALAKERDRQIESIEILFYRLLGEDI